MSPLTRSLLALAAAALLHCACAVQLTDNCARFLIGHRSDQSKDEGATPMPVQVSEREGYVGIPEYGLPGVRVVGQLVSLCNMDNRIAPKVTPPSDRVDPRDLKMYVKLDDGNDGPAHMELSVVYYLEPIYHP